MKLSVLGLGKLGSPMVACFAAKGYEVIGVDVNEQFVQAINEGRPPVFEPGLKELLAQSAGRLSATMDAAKAVRESDITFLMVPTPSKPDGVFSTDYVVSAAETVGKALKDKKSYHVVVLTSTVMPGDTKAKLVPKLEQASGKKCGKEFGVCYSPEFISLGSVIGDFLNPDFVLIGESDERAGETLANIYQQVCENQPPIARMAFVNAELTKISVNTFVTTKISYANMLAQICERLEDGDVDAVTHALGLDRRIGSRYIKGSLGYGGPCFPRDNVAFASLARSLGVSAAIPEATDHINQTQVARLSDIVKSFLPLKGTVAILGLAYKPETNVIERAQGLELAEYLASQKTCITVYDPCANDTAKAVLGDKAQYAGSVADCVADADVVVITTPCKEFKDLQTQHLKQPNSSVTLVDCWRLLSKTQVAHDCNYVGLGTSDVVSKKVAKKLAA